MMTFVKTIKHIMYCILLPREYFMYDGKVYVREWLKSPVELGYHMRCYHGFSESEIDDLLLKARKLLQDGK